MGWLFPVGKKRKYSPYKGEITPAVPNVLERNFQADKPNQKWLTDITEFALPTGKVYLSPIIDCFDGMPVCWKIGTSPDANLVNTMLDDAVSGLQDGEHIRLFIRIEGAITAGLAG
ncbi:DDE-type integrase/transposase/recombinase|uniref:Integrase core domain-containing protein n=1 Tax=Dendrosporobacter quercicolus TaxID=146817 RepID=A0A1G9MCJ6_9FIRM|nr:DDE-type integrase/transposase/recombinase [Dendrosporobacter quercicolus]NSL46981.1 DDE-type integrase/transposase/recombinase [Dendrosporobacter quercicolus DSM 1736]SDL71405.1 Integrase core domain-containing protein [Dendrosporobacter quercicolus]